MRQIEIGDEKTAGYTAVKEKRITGDRQLYFIWFLWRFSMFSAVILWKKRPFLFSAHFFSIIPVSLEVKIILA